MTASGSTSQKPRGMIEGVHKVNTEEMKEEATLLILCATRMEHKSLTEDSPLMMNPLELVLDDGDIHKAIIGFDPSYSLTFVILQHKI